MPHAVQLPSSRWLSPVAWGVGAALATLCAVLVGLRLQLDGIALFWPAAGIAAGLLLVTCGHDRQGAIVGILVALAIGNARQGGSYATAAIIMAGNLAEALLIVAAVNRRGAAALRLDQLRPFAVFLLAGIAIPALVGLGVAPALRWSGHAQGTLVQTWWTWLSSHALGLIATTPLVVLVADALRRPRPLPGYPFSVLISTALLAVFLPLGLLVGWGLMNWIERERADEVALVQRQAANIAADVDRELRVLTDLAELLAGAQQLRSPTLEGAEDRLREVADKFGGHLALIDRDYRQRINTLMRSGMPLPQTVHVDVYRGVFEKGVSTIGDLRTGTVSRAAQFTILVPVRIETEIKYILAFVPHPDTIFETVKRTARPDGWFASVIDGNGRIVARSHRHNEFYGQAASPEFLARMSGSSGLLRSTDLEGRASVTAHHNSSLTGWRTLVWMPLATLEAPLYSAQQVVVALIAAVLATSLGLAWFVGRMLAAPTNQLVAMARELGASQLPRFQATAMREANVVGAALVEASRQRAAAEATAREEVTERKRGEAEVRESRERLSAALKAGELGVFDFDPRSGDLKLDATVYRLWGLPEGEPVTYEVFESAVHPDDLAQVRALIAQALEPGSDMSYHAEFRIVSLADSTLHWVETDGDVTFEDGVATRLVGTVRDITAGKEAQDRIAAIRDALSAETPDSNEQQPLAETRSIEEQFATAHDRRIALLMTGLLDSPPERAFEQVTRLAAGILQAPISLMTVIDAERQFFVSSYGLPEPVRTLRQKPLWTSYCRWVIESEAPVSIHDARSNPLVADIGACKDGFVAYLATPVKDHDGRVIASLCVADQHARAWTRRDLATLQGIAQLLMRELENRAIQADLKRNEAMLAEQRRLYQTVTDNASTALFIMDGRQQCVFMNPAAEAMTGYKLAETRGRPLHDVVHHSRPDGRPYPLAECPIDQAFPQNARERGEEVFVRKDGQFFPVSFTASPIRTASGEPIGTVVEVDDISERKAAEQAMLQRNRQLDLLARASQSLMLASGDEFHALQQVFRGITDLLGVEAFLHFRPSPDARWIELAMAEGITEHDRRQFGRMRYGELLCGRVAESQTRLILEDLQNCTVPGSEVLSAAGATSYAGFPLVASGRLVGTIAFVSRRRTHFRDGEVQTIQTICDQIATTLDRNAAAEAVRVRDERFQLAEEAASGLVYDWNVRSGQLWRSDGVTRLTGYAPDEIPLSKDGWLSLWHPDDKLKVEGQPPDKFLRPDGSYALEYRIRHKHGHWIWVWDRGRAERGEDGGVTRLIGAAVDISERKVREEQIQLLMKEVNHRAKNMLGLVQSIARQTAATDPADFVRRFTDRIQALSANQDLLVNNAWSGVGIEELVRTQLAPFKDLFGGRITIDGPRLRFSSAAAQAFGLALHELVTNAAKHGALSNDVGRVDVRWRRDGDELFFGWQEHDGPPVEPPTRHGFGSTVVTTLAKMTLSGAVRLDFAPEGLIWQLTCPAEKALDGGRYE